MRTPFRVVALALASALPGCAGVQSSLDVHGPEAAHIASLWWLMLALGTAVSVVVVVLLAYALVHRGRRVADDGTGPAADRDEPTNRRALRWIVIGGVAVPTVILTVVLLATFRVLALTAPTTPADVYVEVDGRQFWWDVRYLDADGRLDFVTANELRIPVGRRVRVRLIANEVNHSFWVPSLAGKVDMIPGLTNHIVLHAERAGTYRGQCAEYCGAQHAWMAFLVIAEPDSAYARWAAAQRLAAAEPATPEAAAGRAVFARSACADCHAVRGVSERASEALAREAGGRLGPDLTHLASRRTIAAGMLPNTRGHLGGWVANPQGVKPGSFMPAVPLGSDELVRLLDWLQTLR